MPTGGGLHWDLRGLSVSSAWWAGCSSDAWAIGLGTLPGPEPGGERTLGTAGPGFLEESPERCRGQKLCWASMALWAAGRPSRQSTLSGNTSPSSLWKGARSAIVFTLSRFFFFFPSLLPRSRWPQKPWRSSPCGRKGGGAGKGSTKPRPRSPKRVSPGKNGVSVHPLEFSFHVFSFFFNPLKEARRLAK